MELLGSILSNQLDVLVIAEEFDVTATDTVAATHRHLGTTAALE